MSKRQAVKYFIWFLLPLFFTTIAHSRYIDLDYSLALESHTQEKDRILSIFSIGLNNQHRSQKLSTDINLINDQVYDHKSNEDSSLWNGYFDANYNFTNSISWLMNFNASEINLDTSNEQDEFNSQTISTTETGLQYYLGPVIRGDFTVKMLTKIYSYEETPLDALENSFQVSYEYPLDQNSSLSSRYTITDLEYDSSVESINDTDMNIMRITYSKQFSRVLFDLYLENNKIDFVNQDSTSDTEAYGVNVSYQINSRSNLYAALGSNVEHSTSLNTNIIDPQNPLLISGLVTNKQYTLQYDLNEQFYSILIRLYQYDINSISDSQELQGIQEGILVDVNRQINDRSNFNLIMNKTEDEISLNNIESIRGSFNYRLSENSRYRSRMSLSAEDRVENNIREDDVELLFEMTFRVF